MNLPSAPATPAMTAEPNVDLAALKWEFDAQGFCVVRGLLDQAEVEEVRELFAGINASTQEKLEQNVTDFSDPLARYPRVMQPHRTNATARRYLLHPEAWCVLATLFGEEPLATQSMFYFKPPGARGQAMHQDQFYLMVSPGTCIAAWTAIDDCDAENGGMMVVPGTGEEPVVCPDLADARESFHHAFRAGAQGQGQAATRGNAGGRHAVFQRASHPWVRAEPFQDTLSPRVHRPLCGRFDGQDFSWLLTTGPARWHRRGSGREHRWRAVRQRMAGRRALIKRRQPVDLTKMSAQECR